MDAVRPGEASPHGIDVATERAADEERRFRGDLRALPTPNGLSIFGWVVGKDQAVDEIEVTIDDVRLTRAPVDVDRPDVVEALGLAKDELPGFYVLLKPEGAGESRLSVYAVMGDDERILLGRVDATAASISTP